MTILRNYLRRYTDIPALICLLREKQITLLDPKTWDDKNDSYFLELYREKSGLKSVLALCFTRTSETYHHWRVFAGGASGVCISFKRAELLRAIKKQPGIRFGDVEYLKLDELDKKKLKTENLPFTKRYPFEHESEFRIIGQSRNHSNVCNIPIPLSCIDKITLSPWLNRSLSRHVKETLKFVDNCSGLKIVRSTLISNEDWKAFGESAISKRSKG